MLNHTLVTHSLSDNGKNLREMTLIQMPLSNTPLSYVVGSEYRKVLPGLSIITFFMQRVVQLNILNSSSGNHHEND